MPKNKTHSGTAKRFKVTGKGKLRRERAGHRHILQKKSSKHKRRLEGTTNVADGDVRQVNKMLGR